MILKPLNEAQIYSLYDTHMRQDFPPSELKSIGAIISMVRKDCYDVLGAFDQEERLIAYSLVFRPADESLALLDYFAVIKPMRGGGIGASLLRKLQEYYAASFEALLIECERPIAAPDENEARKRIRFYNRAGAELTDVRIWLFGVEYSILVLPCKDTVSCQNWAERMLSLYRQMLPPELYQRNVRLIRG